MDHDACRALREAGLLRHTMHGNRAAEVELSRAKVRLNIAGRRAAVADAHCAARAAQACVSSADFGGYDTALLRRAVIRACAILLPGLSRIIAAFGRWRGSRCGLVWSGIAALGPDDRAAAALDDALRSRARSMWKERNEENIDTGVPRNVFGSPVKSVARSPPEPPRHSSPGLPHVSGSPVKSSVVRSPPEPPRHSSPRSPHVSGSPVKSSVVRSPPEPSRHRHSPGPRAPATVVTALLLAAAGRRQRLAKKVRGFRAVQEWALHQATARYRQMMA